MTQLAIEAFIGYSILSILFAGLKQAYKIPLFHKLPEKYLLLYSSAEDSKTSVEAFRKIAFWAFYVVAGILLFAAFYFCQQLGHYVTGVI